MKATSEFTARILLIISLCFASFFMGSDAWSLEYDGAMVCHRGGNGKFIIDFSSNNVSVDDEFAGVGDGAFTFKSSSSFFGLGRELEIDMPDISIGNNEYVASAKIVLRRAHIPGVSDASEMNFSSGTIEMVVSALVDLEFEPETGTTLPIYEEMGRMSASVNCELSR